jgi:hypothetical protein
VTSAALMGESAPSRACARSVGADGENRDGSADRTSSRASRSPLGRPGRKPWCPSTCRPLASCVLGPPSMPWNGGMRGPVLAARRFFSQRLQLRRRSRASPDHRSGKRRSPPHAHGFTRRVAGAIERISPGLKIIYSSRLRLRNRHPPAPRGTCGLCPRRRQFERGLIL